MKTHSNFKTAFLQATLLTTLVFGAVSCGEKTKQDDTKEVAEDYNEAKFGNKQQEKDAQYLVNAAEINMEEIQLGKLAQEKSGMKEVKALGKMMEDEHSKSLSDLSALAANKTITIPAGPTEKANDAYKKLSEKSGRDFDKAYCDMMVNGHKDAITLFEKIAAESTDIDIQNWANATLPVLRIHLEHALDCQSKSENK